MKVWLPDSVHSGTVIDSCHNVARITKDMDANPSHETPVFVMKNKDLKLSHW
jgi:hypothetical protein